MPPTELLARRAAGGRARPGDADGTLLDRYPARGDGGAFTALVRPHGPIVGGVCRRVLGDDPAAADTLQATFLVLARRAASVRPRLAVAAWLPGVARRVRLRLGLIVLLAGGVLTAAAVGARVGATPPAEPQAPAASEKRKAPADETEQVARDLYGDLLPAGAVARLGTVRFRGSDTGHSLAYTPDGRFLVGARQVWDAATGKEVRLLGPDSGGRGDRSALSPDGKLVAAAHGAVYERATGRRLYSFGGRFGACPRFSPDGKLLATYDERSRVTLLVPSTGAALRSWGTHKVRGDDATGEGTFAFTPDGKGLITAGGYGAIVLWEPATGAELRRFTVGCDGLHGLAVSPDGSRLAVLGYAKTPYGTGTAWAPERFVRLVDAATGKEIRRTAEAGGRPGAKPDGGVLCVAFAPDGRSLPGGTADGVVATRDPATGEEVRSFTALDGPLYALAFAPGGRRAAVTESGKAVRILDPASGRDLVPAGGHGGSLSATAWPPGGRQIATGGWDRSIHLWDARTGR